MILYTVFKVAQKHRNTGLGASTDFVMGFVLRRHRDDWGQGRAQRGFQGPLISGIVNIGRNCAKMIAPIKCH